MRIYKWVTQEPIKCMCIVLAQSEAEARQIGEAQFDADMGEDASWFSDMPPEVIALDEPRALGSVWNG